MFAVINVLSSTGILWKKNGSHASTISLCYTRSTTNQQWVSIIHWMVLICKQKKKRKLTHNDCCLLFLESQVNKNGCRVVVRQAPLVNDSTINRMVVLKPKHMHRFSCLLQRKVSLICVMYYILNIKQTLLWFAAFAKLPVGSCDVTIAFFATVTGVGRSTYAVQWGNDANIANLQVYYP